MRKDSEKRGERPPEVVVRWQEAFERRCREHGVRITPQRAAVYRVVAADTSHPTAEAVHERLRPAMPSLSLATVYRILESFEAEGLVRRVSTTQGAARFDANLDPHQHLFCRRCGRMSDFEAASLSALVPPRAPEGFRVEALDIRIVGVCSECAAPSGAGGPRGRRRQPGTGRSRS